jgi:hypothetical protein
MERILLNLAHNARTAGANVMWVRVWQCWLGMTGSICVARFSDFAQHNRD